MIFMEVDLFKLYISSSGFWGYGHWNNATAGNGGSGVVVLQIPTSRYPGTYTGSVSVSTYGSNTILKFTNIGSYTA